MASEIRISSLAELSQSLSTADFVPIVHVADNTTYKYRIGNYVVKNSGDETIAGVKTFSSSPVVPTPTTDMQASTKKYVDDFAATLGTSAVLDAGVADGVATLDSSGYLASAQIPPISITDTYVVSSQAAMLALTCQRGDVAVRSDINNTFILKGSDPATLSDWQMLPTPTDLVLSVDGRTGAVDLTSIYVKAYDATHTYGLYSVCFYQGIPYRSLTTNNIGNTPDVSPSYWEVTGGGSGTSTDPGISYVNGQIEKTADGYNMYNDGSAVPVDGTGGTSALTKTFNTTNPLVGSGDLIISRVAGVSGLGSGCSYDFTVDRGLATTIKKIEFVYQTSTNYVDGDMQLYLYDKTNSSFIPLSVQAIPATYGSPSRFLATYIPSTSTQYRIIWHCAVSTTTAYTLEIDDIVVSEKNTCIGAAIGNWNKYNLTIGATTPPTKGTISYDIAKWHQDGPDMIWAYDFKQTGAGQPGVGAYILPLPEGKTINLDLFPVRSAVGSGYISNSADELAIYTKRCIVCVNDASSLYVKVVDTADMFALWGTTLLFNNTNLSVHLSARFACSQWTSNVNLASDFKQYGFNTQSAINTNDTSSFGYGEGGAAILANTVVTYYDVKVGTVQSGDDFVVELRSKVDGSWLRPEKIWIPSLSTAINRDFDNPAVSTSRRTGVYIARLSSNIFRVYFSAGLIGTTLDVIGVSPAGVTWAQVIAAADGFDRWRVRKVSNGNMAEIPTSVRAVLTGQTVTAANADIAWSTIQEDTHKCIDSTKTTFTAPIDGIYLVTGNALATNGSVPATVQIKKNNIVYASFADSSAQLASNIGLYLCTPHTLRLKAGDKIKLSAIGPGTLVADSACFWEITWLGK